MREPQGVPAGMAEMMNNPEMMTAMTSMMSNMTPEDMQRMASMTGGMGGAGAVLYASFRMAFDAVKQ